MGVLADLIALVNGNTEKTLDVLIQEKATETNSNIASVDAKVQAGNNLIGSNNNTGGSVGVGSLSARINKLLTDWTTTRAGYLDTINANVGTLLNGRVVKSVQYGVLQLNPTGSTIAEVTINHAIVNINKSIIIIDGGNNINPYQNSPYISKKEGSSFKIKTTHRSDEMLSQNADISWQLIEFY